MSAKTVNFYRSIILCYDEQIKTIMNEYVSMKDLIEKYQTQIVIFILTFTSFFSFNYYFISGHHLAYGDALSRLDISRKIIDNLTPGLAQLGNIWLPLPQLLMLPFIWNNYLWHSGIAAAIVSMSAFIIGGIFLYKSAHILSNSTAASMFSLCVYALNMNLLYLQTTAMSEALFISSVTVVTFFFIQWIRYENKMYPLIGAAMAISAATLIRYEALALLFASIPMVFGYSWLRSNNRHKAEGKVIMYTLLACLGFTIWTLYLAVIFGDPLYWKNYYAGTKVITSGSTQIEGYATGLNVFQAVEKYFTAVVWMVGLVPTLLAVIAIPIASVHFYKKKAFYFLPLILLFSMFAFMVLTLMRNTPISQPDLTLENILSPATRPFSEFNIRYGLIMIPFVALMCVYLFLTRLVIVKILLFGLLMIQVFSYVQPSYMVIFQLPVSFGDNLLQGTPKQKAMTAWLKEHYDGGLIMISALKNDPQTFQLGFNYRTYIHEGTGKYWKESTKNPQRYATWIVFDALNKDDQVTKFLKNSPALARYYKLVFDLDGMRVYKIKTSPQISI